MQTLNPFSYLAASDLSDAQIFDYWVDVPAWEGLLKQKLNPLSARPVILFGGKGSGKTHLLRHRSFGIQKRRYSNLLAGLSADGYLGIYLRFGSLNATRFKGKGESEEVWQQVFAYYLELLFGEQLIEIVREIVDQENVNDQQVRQFIAEVLSLFDSERHSPPNTLVGIIEYFRNLRRAIDREVNNRIFNRSLNIAVDVSSGSIIFGVPEIIARALPILDKVRFVYMLDEFEELDPQQQQHVNALIRGRSTRTTFHIGSRLHGIATYGVPSSGEENRAGSEFDTVFLDNILRGQKKEYSRFAKKLTEKRLQIAGYTATDPALWFEVQTEEQVLNQILSKERETLPKSLMRVRSAVARAFDEEIATKVVHSLSVPLRPDLEIANTVLFYRRLATYRGTFDPVAEADQICQSLTEFLQGQKKGNEHEKFLDKFKDDVWAQLLRDYDLPQLYQGFADFVTMSEGLPRTLLGMLKNIFDWATFYGEMPFQSTKRISLRAQLKGVLETAEWFKKDDRMLGKNAEIILAAIENLGNLFRENRFADRPSECSLITFGVEYPLLPAHARQMLREAERLSLLIQIPRGHKDKNSKKVQYKYQLNRTLSPLWGLPVGRRGTLTIPVDVLASLFSNDRAIFNNYMRDKLARWNFPFRSTFRKKENQLTLA